MKKLNKKLRVSNSVEAYAYCSVCHCRPVCSGQGAWSPEMAYGMGETLAYDVRAREGGTGAVQWDY